MTPVPTFAERFLADPKSEEPPPRHGFNLDWRKWVNLNEMNIGAVADGKAVYLATDNHSLIHIDERGELTKSIEIPGVQVVRGAQATTSGTIVAHGFGWYGISRDFGKTWDIKQLAAHESVISAIGISAAPPAIWLQIDGNDTPSPELVGGAKFVVVGDNTRKTPPETFLQVRPLSADSGWGVTRKVLYFTRDGGSHWTVRNPVLVPTSLSIVSAGIQKGSLTVVADDGTIFTENQAGQGQRRAASIRIATGWRDGISPL